jgi:surface protein
VRKMSIIQQIMDNDTKSMFYNATEFNSDLSLWNVSNVSDMRYMFHGATSFNTDISGWPLHSSTSYVVRNGWTEIPMPEHIKGI